MADEDKASEKEENKKPAKGNGLIIIIISVVTLLMGAGIGLTVALIMSPAAEEVATETTSKEIEAEPAAEVAGVAEKGDPQFFMLRPVFVVNLPTVGKTKFLQIEVQIMARSSSVIEDVEAYSPLLKNDLVSLFSSQDPKVVVTLQGKEQLRKEALKIVQKVMKENTGKEGVEQVLFTSFVVQ